MTLGRGRLQAEDILRLLLGSPPIATKQVATLSEVSDFNKITESEILLHSGVIRLKIIDNF